MQTNYTLLILITLLAFDSFAQQADYEYSWATRGGGPRDLQNNIINSDLSNSQKVNVIAIDEQNNYYFIVDIGSDLGSTQATFGDLLDPNSLIPITTYNDPSSSQSYRSRDAYLVSTTCEGEFRWHKTIGGGGQIFAYGLGTDAFGGVYVAGNAQQMTSAQTPVHFDQDSIKNTMLHGTTYIVKYDIEGNFQWLKEPNTNPPAQYNSQVFATGGALHVEPNGTMHFNVLMSAGHELEGGAVVADSVYFPHSSVASNTYVGDLGVLRYDKDGDFLGYTRLDINMWGAIGPTIVGNRIAFTYDPVMDRYYIAAFHQHLGSLTHPAIIDGVETEHFYLAAFSAQDGSLAWWHMGDANTQAGEIMDLSIDDQGNIFVVGRLRGNGGTFGGYTNNTSPSWKPFVIAMDSNGILLWGSNADETQGGATTSITFDFDNNEVIIGMADGRTGGGTFTWANLSYHRPSGHGIDPAVVRLDKQTGAGVDLHDILSTGMGFRNYISATAVDKLGNIVVGGTLTSPSLFVNHPNVPEVLREGISKSDFFIAQLAKAGVSCDDLMSVGEVQKPQMRIYPNPAGNILHWQADVGIITVGIYDISGRVVKEQAVTGQSGSLSLEGLSAGSYIVVLQDNTGKSMQKMLIKK